jgi:WhiB family transcriptional regulator, redox-sensing transcriptional regulator
MTAPARAIEVLAWRPPGPGWNLDDFDEPEWQDLALCAETDPELFFPEKGGGSRDAKRICRQCPVRAECLEYALANDERVGVWGGLSVSERDRMAKQAASAPDADADDDPKPCHAGHLRTPDNLYLDGSCRTCKIDRAREKREAAAIAREDAMRRYIEQEMAAA